MGERQRHGDEPAARGAKDRGAVDPEVIEKRDGVLGLLRDGIAHEIIGIVRLAPAPVIHADDPAARQMRQQKLEITGIAGEPREAEERQAVALILVMQHQAIAGGKARHQRAASSGMRVRSGRMVPGRAGSRSTGSPARLTQTVVNP